MILKYLITFYTIKLKYKSVILQNNIMKNSLCFLRCIPRQIIVFTIVCISNYLIINGQDTPGVIPPSPQASSLMRYLDYPVSNATGLPEINIPLYEIKSGQLSVPISLSYHSSGRRVYDKTGAVGIGWTLNAGGMISRTIYGDPDGWNYDEATFPDPWKKEADLQGSEHFPYLAKIDNRRISGLGDSYDTEYDIFSYSVNGLTGKFILKGPNDNKTPVLIPKKPYNIKIIYGPDTYDNPIYGFDLVDENGITYRFGKPLDNNNRLYFEDNENSETTGWMLTEIVSANKEDTIHFKYEWFHSVTTNFSTSYTKTHTYYCDPTYEPFSQSFTGCPPFYWNNNTVEPKNDVPSGSVYTIERIKEISFRQGKIIFNHALDDQCSTTNWPPYLRDNNLRITDMEVRDAEGAIIKKIDFNQSTLNTFTDFNYLAVQKLDNIVFKDRSLSPVETYSFDYYPSPSVMNVRYLDFWGYYNSSGKTDMCPFIPVAHNDDIIVNPNADRSSDLTALKSGVLKKITYPTGGYTEFFYQENKYYDYDLETEKEGNGLRIHQIKAVEGNGDEILKTYKYGIDECGYGDIPLIPNSKTMTSKNERWLLKNEIFGITTNVHYKKEITNLNSNVLPEVSYLASLPVFYTKVTEYLGNETNNIGKTTYTYSQGNIYSATPISTAPVQFTLLSSDLMVPLKYELWKKNDLQQKDIYSYTGNPSDPYSLEKSISYSYNETPYPSETIYGLWIKRQFFIMPPLNSSDPFTPGDPDDVVYCFDPIENNPYLCPSSVCPCNGELYHAYRSGAAIYIYKDYTIEVGKNELMGITETQYTDAGEVETVTSYEYNSNHLVSEKRVTDSKENDLKTTYKYPFDLGSISGITYAQYQDLGAMCGKNQIAPVIEEKNYKNSNLLSTKLTAYKDFGSGKIYPELVKTSKGTNNLETRLEFLTYDDRGNITSVRKTDGLTTSYIWGYNQSLPIAKVENTPLIEETVTTTVTVPPSSPQSFFEQEGLTDGQTYILGTYNAPESLTLNVQRYIIKQGTNHEACYTISFYPGYEEVKDCLDENTQVGNITSQVNLTAGDYEVRLYVQYPHNSGASFNDNIYITCPNYPTTEQKQITAVAPYYNSFEEGGFFTRTIEHRTGKRSYGEDYTVYIPGGHQYILSYWGKKSYSDWELVKQIITANSFMEITIGSGYMYIDDVRLYPVNSMMTTYTYDPFDGMTSETDPNGKTTYYEYDSFGRLKCIKDNDGNKLREYNYHYQNQ